MSNNKNDSDAEDKSSEEQRSSRSQSMRSTMFGFIKGLVPKSPRLSTPFAISRPTSPKPENDSQISPPPTQHNANEPQQQSIFPVGLPKPPISLPKPNIKFDFGFGFAKKPSESDPAQPSKRQSLPPLTNKKIDISSENGGGDLPDINENKKLERAASTPLPKSPELVMDDIINSNEETLALAERSRNLVNQVPFDKQKFFEWCRKERTDLSIFQSKDVDLNVRDEYGRTGMWIAVDNASSMSISILLQRGADPNIPCNAGITPIMIAAFAGDAATISELLKYFANPSIECSQGRTALHYAAIGGNEPYAAIRKLLNESSYAPGVETDLINAQNNDQKWTAAHIACRFGFDEILEQLLMHNADLSLQDARGRIPAALASEFNHSDCLKLIHQQKCPAWSANIFDLIVREYVIDRACNHQGDIRVDMGIFNFFNRIDESWVGRCTMSFDQEFVTFTGWQSDHDVFHQYAKENGIDMGTLGRYSLLELDRPSVPKKDLEGPPDLTFFQTRKLEFEYLMYLPLEEIEAHYRCEKIIRKKNISEFKKILAEGVMDVNLSIPRDYCMPLIHRCVQKNFLPGFKALLAHAQTDVNSKYCGVSVLTEVVDRGLSEFAALLFDCLDLIIEEPDLLRKYVQDSSFFFSGTKMLEVLIDSRLFPLDNVDAQGNNILHSVIAAGDTLAAKVIVTSTCDVQFLNQRNGNKKTPFMLAISKRRREIVRMMYSFPHKILVSKQALLRAVKTNDFAMVQILLERPLVDKNRAFAKSGRTPLHLGVIQGNRTIVTNLLNGIWKPGEYVATQNVKIYKNYSDLKSIKGKTKADVAQEVLLGDPITVEKIKEEGNLIIGKVANSTNAVIMMNKTTKIKYARRGAPACETFMFNFLHHAMGIPMHESEGWLSNAFRDQFDEYDASNFFNKIYHLQMHIEKPFVFPPTDVNIKDSDGKTPIDYAIENYFNTRADDQERGKFKPPHDWMLEEFLKVRPCIPFTLTDAQRNSRAIVSFNQFLTECGRWDMGDQIPMVALSGLWHPRDQEKTFSTLHECFPKKEEKQQYSKPEIYPVITVIMSYLERPGYWKSLLVMASIESGIDFVGIYGDILDSTSIVTQMTLLDDIVCDSHHVKILEEAIQRRNVAYGYISDDHAISFEPGKSLRKRALSMMLKSVKYRDDNYYGFKAGFHGVKATRDEHGNNLLHLCFSHDWIDGASLFLERTAYCSLQICKSTNDRGETPLMRLCQLKNLDLGHIEVLEKIRESLADENHETWALQQAKDGSTALHWAVLNGHKVVVEYILSKSQWWSVQLPTTQYDPYLGDTGTTPLDLALRLGFKEIAEMLESHNDIPSIYTPGRYRFTRPSWIKHELCITSEVVTDINLHDEVEVISVFKHANRVRGQLENGYCTLYNLEKGAAFAEKLPEAEYDFSSIVSYRG